MRAFFSFPLDKSVREEIGDFQSRIDSPARVKWVSSENLHITVKFLGDIKKGQVREIISSAEEATSSFEPFQFLIDKLGAFPDLSYPKVIWLGSHHPPSVMIELNEKLEDSLYSVGFDREDRKYVPHITLGRTKEKSDGKIKKLGANLKKVDFDEEKSIRVERLELMKSELTRSGPVYELLDYVPL